MNKIIKIALLISILSLLPIAGALYPYHMVWVVASDDIDRINLKDAVNQPDYDIRVKVANCGSFNEYNVTVRITQNSGHVLFEGTDVIPLLMPGGGQTLGITIPIDRFEQCDCSKVDKMGWIEDKITVFAYSKNYALEPIQTDNVYSIPIKIKPFCRKM